ncbi:MAG: tetratricopeptide repeat protein [Saprospiraceae bacterium]|nr:tetratricopeptide repeat protein [Saprospiraceae bacterium]
MRQVLQIDEENYDSSHPEIAIHQNNLASLLMAINRYTEAEQIMREALS